VKIVASVIVGIGLSSMLMGCGADFEDESVQEHTIVISDVQGDTAASDVEIESTTDVAISETPPGSEDLVTYSADYGETSWCSGKCPNGVCYCTGTWSCCSKLCYVVCQQQ